MEKNLRLSTYLFVCMLVAGALDSPPAQSQEVKLGNLVISQAWSRAAPRGAEVATRYLTIENKRTTADRLVGGSTDAAENLEIQQLSMVVGGLPQLPVQG